MIHNWSKLALSSFGLSLMIAGCSDSGSSEKNITSSENDAVETSEDLPNCTSKSSGKIVTVTADDVDYICNAPLEEWIKTVIKFADLPTCSKKKEGEVVYVVRDEDYYYCTSSEEWKIKEEGGDSKSSSDKDGNTGKEGDKTTDKTTDGDKKTDGDKTTDGDKKDDGSSSSTAAMTHLDSIKAKVLDTIQINHTVVIEDTQYVALERESGPYLRPSPPITELSTVACSNAMFCAKGGDTRVKTGYTNTTGSDAGWWYTNHGEGASFYWPYGIDEYDSFVNPSVTSAAAIRGRVDFEGDGGHWANLEFHMKGIGEAVNISSWGGLCIIYKADAAVKLRIVPTNAQILTEYNDHAAYLPASTNAARANINWGYFVQDPWANRKVSIDAVVELADIIGLNFFSQGSSMNNFSVIAIGKYNTCR